MWIARYGVTFYPPSDFEDRTEYSFNEDSGRELATVDYGCVPTIAGTAWQLLDQRAGQLEFLRRSDPLLIVEPAVDVRVGPLPGRMLSFVAHEKHYKFRVFWAIALLDASTYVQIVYQVSALDAAAGARIHHMLASVVPAAIDTVPAGQPEFSRRLAGRIFIDIPNRLAPPATFHFVAGDEDEVRLDLMLRDQPTPPPPLLGEVSDSHTQTVIVAASQVSVTRCIVSRRVFDEDVRSWKIQSHL